MKITDNWKIEGDDRCVTLYKKRIIKDKKSKNYGKGVWDFVGYYTDVPAAMQILLTKMTNLSVNDCADLKEFMEMQKEIVWEIRQAFGKVLYGPERREM